MIPDDFTASRLLVQDNSIGRSYLSPDGTDAAYTTDVELGGIALNDPSQGLRVQTWTLRVDGDDIVLGTETVADVVLFTRAGVTQVSLAFDQNMRPFVAFVEAGVAKFWWWDTSVPGEVFTDLPDGSVTPRACIDDKRASENGTSDIILAYVLNNNLYFRAQRDRFGVEYLLWGSVNARLNKVGMTSENRLAFEIAPTSSGGPADPGDGGDPGDPPTAALYIAGSAPDGMEGEGYSYQYTITGGTPPYTVDWVGNPTGLAISNAGLVTGTPTENGTFNITATVTDDVMDTADVVDTVVIAEPVALPLELSGTAPDGVVGAAYFYRYTVTGGYPPYSWAYTWGDQPPGTAFYTGATGAYLSGAPTAAASPTLDITVTDSRSNEALLSDSFVITAAINLDDDMAVLTNRTQSGALDFSSSNHMYDGAGLQVTGYGDPARTVKTLDEAWSVADSNNAFYFNSANCVKTSDVSVRRYFGAPSTSIDGNDHNKVTIAIAYDSHEGFLLSPALRFRFTSFGTFATPYIEYGFSINTRSQGVFAGAYYKNNAGSVTAATETASETVATGAKVVAIAQIDLSFAGDSMVYFEVNGAEVVGRVTSDNLPDFPATTQGFLTLICESHVSQLNALAIITGDMTAGDLTTLRNWLKLKAGLAP